MNAVSVRAYRHQSLSACAVSSGPLSQRMCVGSAAHGGELVEDGDGLVGVDASGDVHRERLAGVLIDDVEQLEHPAVGGLIELEVQGPHVTGPLGSQPIGGHRRLAEALALASPRRDSEAFFAPQALHALAVDRVAELAEADMRAPVAPPRPLSPEISRNNARSTSSASTGSGR